MLFRSPHTHPDPLTQEVRADKDGEPSEPQRSSMIPDAKGGWQSLVLQVALALDRQACGGKGVGPRPASVAARLRT